MVPLPSSCTYNSSDTLPFTVSSTVTLTGQGVNIVTIQAAWNRFKDSTLSQYRSNGSGNSGCSTLSSLSITTLQLNITNTSEIPPQLGNDESYVINIPDTNSNTLYLSCPQIWGCLHGLTTLSQLISYNYTYGGCYALKGPFVINDQPRFQHRGLMLDTARHYYPLPTLYILLDTMALSKFNVFHWHLVDDQSFPLVIPNTLLSINGAFDTLSMYSSGDVQDVVEYARERGIRVLPEIDTPGHSASWCQAYPNICISCDTGGSSYTLDPSNNQTLVIILQVLQTIRNNFVDNMLHLGGDEIDLHCWINNPSLLQWLQNKYPGLSPLTAAMDEAYGSFIPSVQALAIQANYKLDNIVHWEDAFDFASPNCGNSTPVLSNRTIVHVFRAGWGPDAPNGGSCGSNTTYTTYQAVSTGYRVIWMPPSSWYLSCYADHCNTSGGGAGFEDWLSIYTGDPYDTITNTIDQQRILGGEVTVWSERLDSASMVAVAFPRAAVAAERLWSPMNTTDPVDAKVRFLAFQKYLGYRGLPVSNLTGGNEATNWGLPSRPAGPGL